MRHPPTYCTHESIKWDTFFAANNSDLPERQKARARIVFKKAINEAHAIELTSKKKSNLKPFSVPWWMFWNIFLDLACDVFTMEGYFEKCKIQKLLPKNETEKLQQTEKHKFYCFFLVVPPPLKHCPKYR